ncbi:hypothetical protein TcasGA2_TC006178 [Tribolium castaneum]|uniref:Uncharacterized protein n=1 Tax=Tribolium castaneum TaxID=7070 RepID=D6WV18_TRICA|nr:hypothetical protein TcasGA2_TC006178 [Tribolium castaneum]
MTRKKINSPALATDLSHPQRSFGTRHRAGLVRTLIIFAHMVELYSTYFTHTHNFRFLYYLMMGQFYCTVKLDTGFFMASKSLFCNWKVYFRDEERRKNKKSPDLCQTFTKLVCNFERRVIASGFQSGICRFSIKDRRLKRRREEDYLQEQRRERGNIVRKFLLGDSQLEGAIILIDNRIRSVGPSIPGNDIATKSTYLDLTASTPVSITPPLQL